MIAAGATAQQVLATHGRSFRWAQVFLPRRVAADAATVYAFCREVDDLADESPDPIVARAALGRLRAEVAGQAEPGPLVAALHDVLARSGGAVDPALALLRAVEGDLDPVSVPDDAALIAYAWGVAGTVGLLMGPILGAGSRDAAAAAEALGIAMQITNICRDVREDAEGGRIYLPAARLRAAGLPAVNPRVLLAHPAGVAQVVGELLELADEWYARGRAGYHRLPWATRFAVVVAGALYRQIGVRLRREHGCNPLFGRTVVPLHERLGTVLLAVGQLLPSRGRLPASWAVGGSRDQRIR